MTTTDLLQLPARAQLAWLLARSLEAELDCIRRVRLALTQAEKVRLARLIQVERRRQAALRALGADDE